MPALSFAVILAAIFVIQPRAMSYVGMNLMLNLALPIAFATIAQLFVLTIGDLDLSIGGFVSLVACIAATWLNDTPLLGAAALAGDLGHLGVAGVVAEGAVLTPGIERDVLV